ncbi:SGNH hydrolase [Rhodotorula sp. JG-1b]|nr:SGNH hydrolase [Rhodotorula sp. JG-1b]
MGPHDKARAGSVRMDQVVLFGDSITQGSWVPGGTGAALAHVYQRKLDVMNRGFSGYNTEWGLQVLRQFLPRYDEELPKIALFCVWFGANDAALPPSPQALTLAEFKTNLNKILDLLRSPKSPNYSPDTQLLLITPPPVDASKRTADLAQRDPPRSPDRDASRTRQFAEAVKEVAHESNLPVLDAWSLIDSAARNDGGLDKYLNDGLHLTAAGYGVVTAGLFALIKSDLPQLHWSRLGQVFPHWTDFIAPELRS